MREQFAHRPLLAFFFGIVCGCGFTFGFWPFVVFPSVVLGVWRLKFAVFAFVGLGCGLALMPPMPEIVLEKSEIRGEILIETVPEFGKDARLAFARFESQRYRVVLPDGADVSLGDRLWVVGEIRAPSEVAGYARGSVGVIRVSEWRLVRPGFVAWKWADRVAQSFKVVIDGGLSDRAGAIVRGVCFNQTDGLDQDDWRAYRQFGVIHLLSASGFHVAVVAALLLGVISLLPIPRMVQIGIVLAFLGIFAMAAGFRPPIVRAVVMAALALPAYHFFREADSISALSLAGSVYLLFDPSVIADLGFHLSMVTTFALVWWISPDRWGHWGWGQRLVIPTLVATLASFPILGLVFGVVSITGVIGNIVVAPLVGLLVILSLITWIFAIMVPPLGSVGFFVVENLSGVVDQLVQIGAEIPGGQVVVPGYGLVTVLALYGLLFYFGRNNEGN